MKKTLIIIAAIIIFAGVAFFFLKPQEEKPKEKGEIEENVAINTEEFYHRNEKKVDEEQYKKLASFVYDGEINYRTVRIEFKPLEDNETAVYSKYECSVYDPEDAQNTRTRYEVLLDKDMELNYIIGPEKSTYECSFKNGELTINGTRLTKTEPEDYEITLYHH